MVIEQLFSEGWLTERLFPKSDYLPKQSANKLQSAITIELLNEWQDILETDYFIACLFELIKVSFEGMLDLIASEVTRDPNCGIQSGEDAAD